MAMTLRLTEAETTALRAYADATGRSMQDVAREAIRDYVAERVKRRGEILARIVDEDAELLDLLSK
ncbi:MAG: DNA-binding protein [Jatrophihabitantaceae bacterium]